MKLALLMHALLNDSAVVERIQEDAELRKMWVDPALRSSLRAAPQTSDAMAKLLELVRGLTADPAVQQRIQADSALRHLLSQPSVRQRIQPAGRP